LEDRLPGGNAKKKCDYKIIEKSRREETQTKADSTVAEVTTPGPFAAMQFQRHTLPRSNIFSRVFYILCQYNRQNLTLFLVAE